MTDLSRDTSSQPKNLGPQYSRDVDMLKEISIFLSFNHPSDSDRMGTVFKDSLSNFYSYLPKKFNSINQLTQSNGLSLR